MTAINVQASGDRGDRKALRDDPILRNLVTRSPAEVRAHLEGITDPEERWTYTIRVAMAVAYLLKE